MTDSHQSRKTPDKMVEDAHTVLEAATVQATKAAAAADAARSKADAAAQAARDAEQRVEDLKKAAADGDADGASEKAAAIVQAEGEAEKTKTEAGQLEGKAARAEAQKAKADTELDSAKSVAATTAKVAANPDAYNKLAKSLDFKGANFKTHLIVALIMAGCVLLLGFIYVQFANSLAGDWLADDYRLLTNKPEPIEVADDDEAAKPLMKRLEDQAALTRQRALRHLKIAQFFYARYFMAIRLAAILSLVAGVCFVWISRKGFNETGAAVKSIFLLATVGVAFFATYPAIFGQKENLTTNGDKWEKLVALNQQIVTFQAAYGTTSKWDETGASWHAAALPFIKSVDQKLAELNGLDVSLDDKAIGDFENRLGGGAPGSQTGGGG